MKTQLPETYLTTIVWDIGDTRTVAQWRNTIANTMPIGKPWGVAMR